MQNKKMHAVLVADVVASSARFNLRAMLGEGLARASRAHMKRGLVRLPYAVTAGDEFQTILSDLPSIAEVILDLRIRLRPLNLRIGIGVGAISGRVQPPVNRLGGPAFQFARAALESIKHDPEYKFDVLTAFRSDDRAFNSTANLIYGLHDTLVLRITKKQWETIAVFRKKRRLEDAAKALRVDVSTVWRNLRRAHFWQLEETVAGMRTLIRTTDF
ncbi:MAG: SatD family protein [Candidatus Acidiferrales bacterium]